MKRNLLTLLLTLGASLAAGVAQTAQAASFSTGFQTTIGSELNALARRTNGSVSEGGPYHVSVNANNPGYAGFAANLPGTNNAAPAFQRAFTEPVLGYSFVGGGQNGVLNVGRESGGFITYTTTDVTNPVSNTFDSFAQDQLTLWDATDPGADLINATGPDARGPGYRSFGQATGTVDISGLGEGTVTVFYGDFRGTPTLTAFMRDLDGVAADILISNAHLNGDDANRAEYYVAELDFEADGIYDQIVFEYLSGGGNGRFGGAVLTGNVATTVPEPTTAALGILGLAGLMMRRRKVA